MKNKLKQFTTSYIKKQRIYPLPVDLLHGILNVEIFNEKKNSWSKYSYDLCIVLHNKELKTDRKIKITYNKN